MSDEIKAVKPESELADIEVISEKLLGMQVCARVPLEEVKAWGNGRYCGTSNGWQYAEELADQGVTCQEYPNRRHYIFHC